MGMIGKQRGTSDKQGLVAMVEKEALFLYQTPLVASLRTGQSAWNRLGIGVAGKQGRHVRPFLMRCLGVSKDDGCLTKGNHKSLPLPQV